MMFNVSNVQFQSSLKVLIHSYCPGPRCHNSQVLLWGRSSTYNLALCPSLCRHVSLNFSIDWRLLKCFFTNGALYTLFPGRLCENRLAIRRFGELLDICGSAQDALYHEILATDTGTDINCQWSREVYLCEPCFLNCLREKVLAWHVRKLLKSA